MQQENSNYGVNVYVQKLRYIRDKLLNDVQCKYSVKPNYIVATRYNRIDTLLQTDGNMTSMLAIVGLYLGSTQTLRD